MNAGKYIAVKFYKIRGCYADDDFEAMLFVSLIDCLYYWATLIFINILFDYRLLSDFLGGYMFIQMSGSIAIFCYRKVTLYNNKQFVKVIKEVEEEPQKKKWAIFSFIYFVMSFGIFGLAIYCLWTKCLNPNYIP